MKKTILYIGSFALAAFIGLTAFSDAQTDDQKIEAKYQEMVTNFKAEKTAACKLAAVSTAEAQYQATMNSMGATDATTSGQPSSGGSNQPAVKPSTGGTSPVISSGTKPTDNTIEEAPVTTTTKPTNTQSDRTGATTTNAEDQKDRGGATTTNTTDQKGRGGATIKND